MPCKVHTDFFNDSCEACRQEYLEMMKGSAAQHTERKERKKKYKEFTEERAKKLFQEIMLQYLKSGSTDLDAAEKAKAVVRKQCAMRNIQYWPWL